MLKELLNHVEVFNYSPHMVAMAVIIFSVLLLFVAVRSVKRIWVAATIPLALALVATLVVTIHNISGQPTERDPRGEFEYLGYTIGANEEWMYLWIIEHPEINRVPITVRVPYSEQSHDEADKGDRFAEKGVSMAGDFTGGKFALHPFSMRQDLDTVLKKPLGNIEDGRGP